MAPPIAVEHDTVSVSEAGSETFCLLTMDHVVRTYKLKYARSLYDHIADYGIDKRFAKQYLLLMLEMIRQQACKDLRALHEWGLRAGIFGPPEIDRLLLVAWQHRASAATLRELRRLEVAEYVSDRHANPFMHNLLAYDAANGEIGRLRELQNWGLSARTVREADYLPVRLAAHENHANVLNEFRTAWNITAHDAERAYALKIARDRNSMEAMQELLQWPDDGDPNDLDRSDNSGATIRHTHVTLTLA